MDDFDALILAGGAGRRLAGADKALLDVGGIRLLDRAIDAVADAGTIVVVGPRRPIEASTSAGETGAQKIVFTRERPAGSGPAAAVMHGLTLVTRPIVVVIAVDVPFAAAAVPRLLAALHADTDREAAMAIDDTGRRQPLLAAYRTAPLRDRPGDWANRSVQALVTPLQVVEVTTLASEALDCDTPDDLERARQAAAAEFSSAAVVLQPSRRTPRTPPAR